MNDSPQNDSSPSQHPSSPGPSTGRRALLVAMPAIFSLRQGVAAEVARTSAVLVKSETETLLCAKDPGLGENAKGWFVPDSGQIDVTKFTSGRTYCKYDGLGSNDKPKYAAVSTNEMCSNGGTYYVSNNSNNCNSVQTPGITVNDSVRGAFVSALSIASFGARINYTNV